jgi:hypothetical protein
VIGVRQGDDMSGISAQNATRPTEIAVMPARASRARRFRAQAA